MAANTERLNFAKAKLQKAEQLLLGAQLLLDVGNEMSDAVVSLCVSASINASDALLALAGGAIAGRLDDHQHAVAALKRAGEPSASTHLANILALKDKAQYSARFCTMKEALNGEKRSARLVDRARAVVNQEAE